jgi:hypothetical protein
VRGMEAILGVLVVFSIVVWIRARIRAISEQSAPAPVRPHRINPLYAPRSESGLNRDHEAFVDGYIWGRLQERHDEQQHHGVAGGNDYDVFGDDDCFDHGG